jgi:hypothetical protein
MQRFGGGNQKERDHLKDLSINGRTVDVERIPLAHDRDSGGLF